jgi:hypothetical protein
MAAAAGPQASGGRVFGKDGQPIETMGMTQMETGLSPQVGERSQRSSSTTSNVTFKRGSMAMMIGQSSPRTAAAAAAAAAGNGTPRNHSGDSPATRPMSGDTHHAVPMESRNSISLSQTAIQTQV